MHHRRLELVKFKQALFGYLGPLSPEHKSSDAAGDSYRRNLQGLLTDVEMLLSLYNDTMRIYNWHTHATDSDYKAELASEQVEEARESKVTAKSLGKLSNLAFLYLPLNFVCAMLGMNDLRTRAGPFVGISRLSGIFQSPDILPHLPICN